MGIESPTHLIFIAVIALVVLGPKRLPDLAKALGQGIREFRESMDLGARGAEHAPPPAASIVSAPAASSSTPAPAPDAQATDVTTPPAVTEIVAAATATSSTPAPAPVAAAVPDPETTVSTAAAPAPGSESPAAPSVDPAPSSGEPADMHDAE
jgi:TatA/E family protein of Tat protein translocase